MNNQRTFIPEEIRLKMDIVKVVSERTPLLPSGSGYEGNCPFRPDRTPSFHVYPDKQEWQCLGECAEKGDVISFVMRAEHLTLGETLRKLAVRCGIAPTKPAGDQLSESMENPGEARRMGDPRDAPADPLEYVAWLRRKREQLTPRNLQDIVGSGFRGLDPLLRAIRRENRNLVVGRLGYRQLISLMPDPVIDKESERIGIVISLPETLNRHAELEYPDESTEFFDASALRNGGEITWCDGEAIYKELISGRHASTPLKGCSSRGFCLIKPEGSRDYHWIYPREPGSMGGRERAYYYRKEGEATSIGITLESFYVQNTTLDAYTDITGVTVPIRSPERSPRRHRDALGGPAAD